MNKEQQIEEMINDIDYACTKSFLSHNDIKVIANELFLLGYRKAYRVMNETAKEIFEYLNVNLKQSCKINDYYNVVGLIEDIAKEYGIKIEE